MPTDPGQPFEFGGEFYDEMLGKLDILIAMAFALNAHDNLTEGLQEFKAWIEDTFKEQPED